MVRRLLAVRDAITAGTDDAADEDLHQARADAMAAVNDYFERALTGVPTIKAYLDDVAATHGAHTAGA
jgi:hypothetical protein